MGSENNKNSYSVKDNKIISTRGKLLVNNVGLFQITLILQYYLIILCWFTGKIWLNGIAIVQNMARKVLERDYRLVSVSYTVISFARSTNQPQQTSDKRLIDSK